MRRRRAPDAAPGDEAIARRLAALPPEAWAPADPPPLRVATRTPTAGRMRRPVVLRPAVAALCSLVLVGAGVAGGLVVGGGGAGGSHGGSGPVAGGVRAALAPVGTLDPAAHGSAQLVRAGGGELELRIAGLAATDTRDFYEAWLMSSGSRLVALGSFRVGADGTARVRVPLGVDPRAFRYLDVSLEPADGNPGHSGASVLRGDIRRT